MTTHLSPIHPAAKSASYSVAGNYEVVKAHLFKGKIYDTHIQVVAMHGGQWVPIRTLLADHGYQLLAYKMACGYGWVLFLADARDCGVTWVAGIRTMKDCKLMADKLFGHDPIRRPDLDE
jgi:hypothetical protein